MIALTLTVLFGFYQAIVELGTTTADGVRGVQGVRGAAFLGRAVAVRMPNR